MSEKNIKLVIAEKPSVAQSIAKVIGADKREDGYLEEKICKTLIRRFICNVWFYFCNNAGVNTISSSGISVSPK